MKSKGLKNFSDFFEQEKTVAEKPAVDIGKLYAKIGEMTLENVFFKSRLICQSSIAMIDCGSRLSVSRQCKILGVHRSGLYYSPKPEKDENLEIMKLLEEKYFSTPFYGCRKLTAWLQELGYKVNRKRVKWLMNKVNWKTIYRQPKTTVLIRKIANTPIYSRDWR